MVFRVSTRVVALLVLLLGACGDSSDQGEVGAHCYPNGTCNVGLSCSGGYCYPADASITADARPDASPDAATACTTTFEPNDTIQTATATPVATSQLAVTAMSERIFTE